MICEPAYSVYLDELQQQYLPSIVVNSTFLACPPAFSLPALLATFASWIRGYYLAESHTASINVAISVAGLDSESIVATAAHVSALAAAHIPMLKNLTGTDDQWLLSQIPAPYNGFNSRIMASQDPVGASSIALSDWSVFSGAAQFYQMNLLDSFFAKLIPSTAAPPAVCFGWNDEHTLVEAASQHAAGVVASDWSAPARYCASCA
jgi:hypothetical protein